MHLKNKMKVQNIIDKNVAIINKQLWTLLCRSVIDTFLCTSCSALKTEKKTPETFII